jgi:hypothetical protein
MTKKNWLMTIVLVALAGIYVVYFTDWFKPKIIHITHTSRTFRDHRRSGQSAGFVTEPIAFGFDQAYRFSEIKVVPVAALATNKNALPVWHLTSDSNSVPVKFFFYGQRVRGMKFAVAGVRPEPLQPGTTYRLLVTAGSAKGQHDFQPVAVTAGP